MSVLVVDVGTSGVRAAIVRDDGTVTDSHHVPVLPRSPMPGLVEFDAQEMATAVRGVASAALELGGPVQAVGIANQRASTIVWDRRTGEPVGPGIGWQDLRTVGECLVLQGQGISLAPNLSATKIAALLAPIPESEHSHLCFGTVDSWVAWTLSNGALHVTDPTNAALTGLRSTHDDTWDQKVLDALHIPADILPTVVDTSGVCGELSALAGSPTLGALAGDQQASLIGQGCVEPGQAKITFGTGGMLDLCTGTQPPTVTKRGEAGTFPIVTRSKGGNKHWGLEAVMLAAGTNVEWLRDDLGIITSAAESDEVAASCTTTDGVVYVPALLGLGTPWWDYGARGTLLGVTRGTGRPELVRAVLEGIAQRGADLLDAAQRDSGLTIDELRVDGGMSDNTTFLQALANATARPIAVSPEREATTLGAGYFAGIAAGVWRDEVETAGLFAPRCTVEPTDVLDRKRWKQAVEKAKGWYPELSGLDF